MKSASLKIVTNEQTTQRSGAAIIEDEFPPPIHAVAQVPMPPRLVRRLDVDGVLARSLPKTLAEVLPLQPDQNLSQI
jgi:hypothetical protein